jgi:tellurite resistance protein TehA-like permease
MLLGALGLAPHDKGAAEAVVAAGLVASLLVGGWLIGDWLAGPIDERRAHPGYFIPVLGDRRAGDGHPRHRDLAWLCLGLGLVGWLMLGSVVMARSMFGPELPTPLRPTMAIEIAPPAVGSTADLTIHGEHADPVALGLAGFVVLMVLAQVRLLPLYPGGPVLPELLGLHVSVGGRHRTGDPLARDRAAGEPADLRRDPDLGDHRVHRSDRGGLGACSGASLGGWPSHGRCQYA